LFAFIQLEKNCGVYDINSILTSSFPNQLAIEDVARENVSIMGNSTRAEIYDFIVANPGIQFRGLCAGLDIAIGTAEFHLGVLKKAGLISFIRDGKYKRFFASRKFSLREMKLIALLRHKTVRDIVRKISAEKTVGHAELASFLCITSQGLTWQMSRLKQEGIVQESCRGIRATYTIVETYSAILPQLLNGFDP
jgi:predicted transcriptional regulator